MILYCVVIEINIELWFIIKLKLIANAMYKVLLYVHLQLLNSLLKTTCTIITFNLFVAKKYGLLYGQLQTFICKSKTQTYKLNKLLF